MPKVKKGEPIPPRSLEHVRFLIEFCSTQPGWLDRYVEGCHGRDLDFKWFRKQDPEDREKIWDKLGELIGLVRVLFQRPNKAHSSAAFVAMLTAALDVSEREPFKCNEAGTWWFKGFNYIVDGHYTDEEYRLLIIDAFDKERRDFERLRRRYAHEPEIGEPERLRIVEQVRIDVWRRDSGKCVRCGSRDSLEYDHIIPVSKGGGNTTRNIELLCERCNREKGARIQ